MISKILGATVYGTAVITIMIILAQAYNSVVPAYQ